MCNLPTEALLEAGETGNVLFLVPGLEPYLVVNHEHRMPRAPAIDTTVKAPAAAFGHDYAHARLYQKTTTNRIVERHPYGF